MSIEDDVAYLERVPTLALLGREALRILAIGAENRYVHSGNVLFREGETADSGYVVQEGAFALSPAGNGAGEPVTVGAGTLLGELALITETKRRVTATAQEPSTVIRIPRSLFLKMLEGYPDAAARLRDDILRRADESTREMARVRTALDDAESQY
jgi:CRP-like cAMP-binding protein